MYGSTGKLPRQREAQYSVFKVLCLNFCKWNHKPDKLTLETTESLIKLEETFLVQIASALTG